MKRWAIAACVLALPPRSLTTTLAPRLANASA